MAAFGKAIEVMLLPTAELLWGVVKQRLSCRRVVLAPADLGQLDRLGIREPD